jgi:hypothetical protein
MMISPLTEREFVMEFKPGAHSHGPWNKGTIVGQKAPFSAYHLTGG